MEAPTNTEPRGLPAGPGPAYPPAPRPGFFREQWWLAMLAPLLVYMLVPLAFPAAAPGDHLTPDHYERVRSAYASSYLWRYTAMASLLAPLLIFLPAALVLPRFRVSPVAIAVGAVGVVLWVGIDAIGLNDLLRRGFGEESLVVTLLGLTPRDAFDPRSMFDGDPTRYWWFLAVRFIGLAAIVPVVEELMLRGWLMRMVEDTSFWRVPFGDVSVGAAAIGVAFATLYHPEKLPAVVWFSLTTWLMYRTKNFWDCVVAHAVTNLLLGVWVVSSGQWRLW